MSVPIPASTTVVSLRRYVGHARSVWPWLLGGNAVVIATAAGLDALLSSVALPVPARVAGVLGGAGLVLGLVVLCARRRRGASVGRLALTPQILTVQLGRGRSLVCPLTAVSVRRLAYLHHEGGVGHEHLPVLELRLRGEAPILIAGEGAVAWSQTDGDLYAAPLYVVDGAGWSALGSSFGVC
ncbi:MAG: hypothetical protein AAGF11_17280 [Myxococcota bacterium]